MNEATMTRSDRVLVRTALTSQFKALLAEIAQRTKELRADIDLRCVEMKREEETLEDDLKDRLDDIMDECNRQLREAVATSGIEDRGCRVTNYQAYIREPTFTWNRTDFRWAAFSEVEAKASEARTKLARQEADLLRQLAVANLDGEAAKKFLDSIPTVSALVPASRLAELESALENTNA